MLGGGRARAYILKTVKQRGVTLKSLTLKYTTKNNLKSWLVDFIHFNIYSK